VWIDVTDRCPFVLGAFAKLRIATITSVVSVRVEQLGSHWTDFHEIWVFFENLSWKFEFHKNLTRITGNIHTYTNIHFWKYRTHFVLEGEIFQTKLVEKIRTHFILTNLFFSSKIAPFLCNVEKYRRAGKAHAHCMLNTKSYTHPLKICNTYFFSIATTVVRTLLNVTLYVYCLYC
jgi:hypothetical protein